jgi:hypothetical protein
VTQGNRTISPTERKIIMACKVFLEQPKILLMDEKAFGIFLVFYLKGMSGTQYFSHFSPRQKFSFFADKN